MREADVLRVALVRACEESDPDARFVPAAERARATREADGASPAPRDPDAATVSGPEGGDALAFLGARSRPLAAWIEDHYAGLGGARRVASLRLPALAVLAIAFLSGVSVEALGGERFVHLLSFPLLSVIAWNLVVYAMLAVGALHRAAAPPAAAVAAWLGGVGRWLVSPDRFWRRVTADERRFVGASLARFFALWRDRAGDLLAARTSRLLHLGAAAFGMGVVAGMYVEGFDVQYRAGWESTFLDAEAVHALLGVLLAPAAWLLGTPLPGVEAIAEIGETGQGDAAFWIHLWALTALGVVVLPRLALAAFAGAREVRLGRSLSPETESPWALRLLAPARGEGQRVRVVPYSYRPSPRVVERVRELLLELCGNRADVELCDPVGYGHALPPDLLGAGDAPPAASAIHHFSVLVFNVAQSPEQEVQGELLDAAKAQIRERPGDALLVLLDEAAYRERLGGDGAPAAEARVAERCRSWERLVRACGLRAARLGSGGDAADVALAGARGALWPGAGGGGPVGGGVSAEDAA